MPLWLRPLFRPRPPPPTISNVYPSSGKTSGGDTVTITGANLDQVKNVYFKAPLQDQEPAKINRSTSMTLVVTFSKVSK